LRNCGGLTVGAFRVPTKTLSYSPHQQDRGRKDGKACGSR